LFHIGGDFKQALTNSFAIAINNNHNRHVKSFKIAIESVPSNVTDYTFFFYLIYLMYEALKLEFTYINFVVITMDGTKYMNYTIFYYTIFYQLL